MVLSDELRTELFNPESWHWKIHQKGLRNHLRGAVRLVRGLVSREQVHVVEILEELERKKKDAEFKELWVFLGELQKRFTASGHNEAAAAVQKTIDDFREDAKKRKGRRALLLAGGGLLLAEAVFELAGGRGLIRTVHGFLTSEESRELSKEELANVRLSKEVLNPSFHIGDLGVFRQRAEYYVEDVKNLLKAFDRRSACSLDDIRRQTAFLEFAKDDYSMITEDIQVETSTRNAQKILIPTRDPRSMLFISDLHSLKIREEETRFFWVDQGIFKQAPKKDFDFVQPDNVLLAYSEELDLALGWCIAGNSEFNLKMPSFSTHQTRNKEIHVVPSGSKRNKEFPPVKGKGINGNASYFFVNATIKRGYSGAPLTFNDGSIAGILVAGAVSAEGKSLGLALGVKAAAIKQLLEFYIKAMGNKTVEQVPR